MLTFDATDIFIEKLTKRSIGGKRTVSTLVLILN